MFASASYATTAYASISGGQPAGSTTQNRFVTYQVLRTNAANRTVTYLVIKKRSLTRTLSYVVVPEGIVVKDVKYTVTSPLSITKNLGYEIVDISIPNTYQIQKGLTYRLNSAPASRNTRPRGQNLVSRRLRGTVI